MSGDILFDGLRDSLDHCVKCTICETACPVSNVTPLFPGPKYAGPQSERLRVAGEPTPDASVDYCSGCGICSMACPQGVQIAEINSRARSVLKAEHGTPLRDQIISRPTVLGRLGVPFAPYANASLKWRWFRVLVEWVLRIHRDAPVPSFANDTFQHMMVDHKSPESSKRLVYFHGCGTDYYEPDLGEKVVAVLEHNGFQVEIPKQDCCGLPLQSNGLFPAARKYVTNLAQVLAPYVRDGATVVGNATSCTLMVKREGREILGLEDDEDLALVSANTYDVMELLLECHHRGELKTDFQAIQERVVYHAPCQQQGHWMGKPALDVLALIPQLEVVESESNCCGIAGTYGLKAEKYDIAMQVGAGLFEQVAQSGATSTVCDSETCRWQIGKATQLPSAHPIELLHRAYGL